MIGWNENLHTLGPPWQRLDIPGLASLSYRPDWWIAAEMVVLLEGSPLSTEERWSSDRVTIGFLVTSLKH